MHVVCVQPPHPLQHPCPSLRRRRAWLHPPSPSRPASSGSALHVANPTPSSSYALGCVQAGAACRGMPHKAHATWAYGSTQAGQAHMARTGAAGVRTFLAHGRAPASSLCDHSSWRKKKRMGGGASKNAVAPAEAAGQLRDTLQQLQEEQKSHSKLQVLPGTPTPSQPGLLPASVDQAHRAEGSLPNPLRRLCRSSHCTASAPASTARTALGCRTKGNADSHRARRPI